MIFELCSEEIHWLKELPYTITLPQYKSIIVHAGLLPGIPLAKQTPDDCSKMRSIVQKKKSIHGTDSGKVGVPWASLWNGPEHIYFGHDAKRGLQLYPYATGLDTGCVYGNYGFFSYITSFFSL